MKKRFLTILACVVFLLNMYIIAVASDQQYALTISLPTPVSGAFFTRQWGNNTSDIDIRYLLHGYATVEITTQQESELNQTVVSNLEVTQTQTIKTYNFSLNKNLKWNNGKPITSSDYAFSLLLQNLPAFRQLGPYPESYSYIVGVDDYVNGKTQGISGLNVIDEYNFSISINKEYLPNFYELSLLQIYPYPQEVLAKNSQVKMENGMCVLNPQPTVQELQNTVLNPQTGYLSNPQVNCGPYTLTGYDKINNELSFEINPNFIGDYKGQIPSINSIKVLSLKNEDAIKALKNNSIDIVHKLVNANDINKAKGIKNISSSYYPRRGYTFLSFNPNDSVTSSLGVRKAIAYAFDRKGFTKDYLKGYGTQVFSDYGLGHWAAVRVAGIRTIELNSIKAYDNHLNVPFEKYDKNLNKAKAELQNEGYVLNKDGKKYTQGIRYKQGENGLQKLSLTWLVANESTATNTLLKYMQHNLKSLGFELNIEKVPFNDMLNAARGVVNKGNMYFWGTNFSENYQTFNISIDNNMIKNDKLKELSNNMLSTQMGDVNAYYEKWIEYQQEYSKELPTIPVYSNIYADFYTPYLRGYKPMNYYSWAQAILYARK